jgi:hypothetical protein
MYAGVDEKPADDVSIATVNPEFVPVLSIAVHSTSFALATFEVTANVLSNAALRRAAPDTAALRTQF